MQIFRHPDALPAAARGAVTAIGNFDGVHLGHQAVIGRARAIAGGLGAPTAVLSFEPHPRSVLQQNAPAFRLTPFRAKAEQLQAAGADLFFCLRFDRSRAGQSAEEFVTAVLVGGLGIRHAVVGHDFVFGHRRSGSAALLQAMGAKLGFGVTVIDPVASGAGEIYSSTRIREHLAEGRPEAAAALLGRPFAIEGRVAHGDKRGRTIGFPTANLGLDGYCPPRFGVYAVRAVLPGGTAVGGVANLGLRPTVGGTAPRLEAHLFDFSGDLYGRHVAVELLRFVRPEQKFDGLPALKAQIARDVETARAILAGGG